jgi:1,4-dihydroxy-6-naphthoate synthase
MGDGYGPMVVAKRLLAVDKLSGLTIAVPGKLTSAFLALRLCLGKEFNSIEVPFDEIIPTVVAGNYRGEKIDAGLIIHEGQLTYGEQDLKLAVDLGTWWQDQTGLPLPLGANAIRKDLGDETIREVQQLLKASIQYGLSHRQEALDYALQYGRDLDNAQADRFVGMYVNDWTLDFGPRGRQAVAEFLRQGHAAGVLPRLVMPEFVD